MNSMDIRNIFIGIALLVSGFATYADRCTEYRDTIRCDNVTVRHLYADKEATVQDSIIKGNTIINGKLYAGRTKFASLNVNGQAELDTCTVSGPANISNIGYVTSVTFEQNLDVFSPFILLVHTIVKGNLHSHHTESNRQVVYLASSSEVLGNIVFNGKNGVVIIDEGSNFNGKVIGGVVIFKKHGHKYHPYGIKRHSL